MAAKWLSKLKSYAPDIASAILSGGATLPSLALKAVSDALGTDISNVDALGAAVNAANPETMLKLKQADNAFKIQMTQLSNELTATELADIQHAREHHKTSKMPSVICVALTVLVAILLAALFSYDVPVGNTQVVNMITGQVITLWGGSVVYFIGTTRSSGVKTIGLLQKTNS